jgi:hypothetical protein
MRPSFIYHQVQAILVLILIFMTIYLSYNAQINLLSKEMLVILLLISINIGIHSNLHYQEEIHFNFNPLIGNSKINDYPYYSKNIISNN